MPALLPAAALQEERRLAEEAAYRNYEAIVASGWHNALAAECECIKRLNAGHKVKLRRFRDLADRIAAEISPHSVCTKGCTHCCHIAVSLTQEEADAIGSVIGVVPARVTTVMTADSSFKALQAAEVARSYGEPCPFLANGGCAIYANRPIACRLHFNIGHSPLMCSQAVRPEDSVVPNVDLLQYWLALIAGIGASGCYADIRMFFPNGLAGTLPKK